MMTKENMSGVVKERKGHEGNCIHPYMEELRKINRWGQPFQALSYIVSGSPILGPSQANKTSQETRGQVIRDLVCRNELGIWIVHQLFSPCGKI